MNAVQPGQPLSPREAEILRQTALGKTDAEIGDNLFNSYRTIRNHQMAIKVKLGAKDRANCVLLGLDYIIG